MAVIVRTRRGFTLAEAVIAGGIVAIMFAAAMATLTVATRTVDPPAAVSATRLANDVLDSIREDLESASSVTFVSAAEISLTVPDRDGDTKAEVISIRRDATERTLVRTLNGGAAQTLLSGVASCAFNSTTRREPAIGTIKPFGTVFALSAAPDHPVKFEFGPTLLTGLAAVVTPDLPTSTTSWKVTGLRLRGRRASAPASSVTIALRTVQGGFPSSTILTSVDVRGATFPVSADWVTIDLPDVVMPVGETSVGFTITSGSVLPPCALEAQVMAKSTPWDTVFQGTLVLWTTLASNDLSYELLGEIELPQSGLTEQSRIGRCVLTLDDAPGATFERMARLQVGGVAVAESAK
jgi:type II secretory pathway pseudopilin PulG